MHGLARISGRDWHSAAAQVATALLCAFLLAGCGGNSLNRQIVSGTVTLDGKPLAHGSIRFEPQPGAPGTASGTVIQSGKFRIAGEQGLPPGRYKVAISAAVGPPPKPSMDDHDPPRADLVPARYNTNTELVADVTAGGKNEFTYALTSEGQNK